MSAPRGASNDPRSLERFLYAQRGSFNTAMGELRRGRKQSHWMWFIFPQLRGLGRSDMAWHFGLADAAEASAYLAHPVLGPRLAAAAEAVLAHAGTPAEAMLGPVDAGKLRSSMTLFEAVPGAAPAFARVLDTFYDGRRCFRTRTHLEGPRDARP